MSTEETKVCADCGQEQPITEFREFHSKDGSKSYRNSRCRKCYIRITIERRKGLLPPKESKPIITEKACKVCGVVKKLEEFPTSRRGETVWHLNTCKDCVWEKEKQHRLDNPSRVEGLKASYERNKEKYVAKSRERYHENIEEERARDREWSANNPDKVKAKKRQQYEKMGREANAAASREYRKKNPEKMQAVNRFNAHRRRTREIQGGSSFTPEEWNELLEKYNHTCLRCGKNDVSLSADHIIAVSLGGSNAIENIQVLCRSCNSSKGTKHIDYRPESEFWGMELSLPIRKPK